MKHVLTIPRTICFSFFIAVFAIDVAVSAAEPVDYKKVLKESSEKAKQLLGQANLAKIALEGASNQAREAKEKAESATTLEASKTAAALARSAAKTASEKFVEMENAAANCRSEAKKALNAAIEVAKAATDQKMTSEEDSQREAAKNADGNALTEESIAKAKSTVTDAEENAQKAEKATWGSLRVVLSDSTPAPVIHLHDSIQIKATKGVAKQMREETEKPGASRKLALYLNGVLMDGLRTTWSAPSAEKPDEITLGFFIERDSHNETSRTAWDAFFRTASNKSYQFPVEVSVSVGSGIPLQVDTNVVIEKKTEALNFAVANTEWIVLVLGVGISVFVVALFVLTFSTNMLKDNGMTGASYSLARTQLAFWGLLVLFTFIGIAIVTGGPERIPDKVLMLLGISTATTLGAVTITYSKEGSLQAEKAELEKLKDAQGNAFPQEKAARLSQIKALLNAAIADKLRAEQAELEKFKDAQGNFSDQDKSKRLAAIVADLALVPSPDTFGQRLQKFLPDICTDENGNMSFHRLQALLWTLTLGGYFVCTVSQTVSMPEFDSTLLILMGISSLTYLGFKIPEKP